MHLATTNDKGLSMEKEALAANGKGRRLRPGNRRQQQQNEQ
jgi:hypothetical protein